MARRTTYIYKVIMGKNGIMKEIAHCYARNAKRAVEGMKELYKDQKYDNFKVVAFGEAEGHNAPFEIMPPNEVATVLNNKLGEADKYSNRKDKAPFIPEGAVFVPVEKETP